MVVILANGQFPTHPACLTALNTADAIICCDGAAEKLLAFGREPDLVVGDCDSLPLSLKGHLGNRLIHVSEQETNDLNKAFRTCLSKGWCDITILGATGLREDHTLGNISLLSEFSRSCPQIRMITDSGTFFPFSGTKDFNTFHKQQISVFSFSPQQHFFSDGLEYPLNGMTITTWWQATLNRALGNRITLTVKGEGPAALVFFTHPSAL